jgi:cation transport regulator ChaC
MRMLVAMTAITLALVLNVAFAEAAGWCVWYGVYTYNCGFHTLDQCRATVRGDTSAFCARNVERGSAYDRRHHS